MVIISAIDPDINTPYARMCMFFLPTLIMTSGMEGREAFVSMCICVYVTCFKPSTGTNEACGCTHHVGQTLSLGRLVDREAFGVLQSVQHCGAVHPFRQPFNTSCRTGSVLS
jgi:hypothetical protein